MSEVDHVVASQICCLLFLRRRPRQQRLREYGDPISASRGHEVLIDERVERIGSKFSIANPDLFPRRVVATGAETNRRLGGEVGDISTDPCQGFAFPAGLLVVVEKVEDRNQNAGIPGDGEREEDAGWARREVTSVDIALLFSRVHSLTKPCCGRGCTPIGALGELAAVGSPPHGERNASREYRREEANRK